MQSDPGLAAESWRKHINLIRKVEKLYPDDVLVIHYESMIKDLLDTLSQISNLLQLSHLEDKRNSPADVAHEIPKRYEHIHKNVNKMPIVSRIDDWKSNLSAEEIDVIEQIAGEELKSEGYRLLMRNC